MKKFTVLHEKLQTVEKNILCKIEKEVTLLAGGLVFYKIERTFSGVSLLF